MNNWYIKPAKICDNKYVLDLRGYVCPYPVIYTIKVLNELKGGNLLEVIIDNPPSCETIPRAVRDKGYSVVSIKRMAQGEWKIIIRR